MSDSDSEDVPLDRIQGAPLAEKDIPGSSSSTYVLYIS